VAAPVPLRERALPHIPEETLIINTPVHVAISGDDPTATAYPSQPVAVECPVCFAIVRQARAAAHWKVMHAEGGE